SDYPKELQRKMGEEIKISEASDKDVYFPIPINIFQIDKILNFDLYFRTGKNNDLVLYRSKDLPITAEDISRLREYGIEVLYARSEDRVQYRKYLEKNLKEILSDKNISPEKKSEVIYNVTTQAVKEMLSDPRAGDLVPRSKHIVEASIEYFLHEDKALECMLKVLSFDYYTHTHSVNVSMFAIFLAKEVGIDGAELLRFGMGALLHDIGKCRVDPEIVNFPGKLSPEQFEKMKKHPEYGFDILTAEQNLKDELVLDVVKHHHEKLNGKGYPDKLTGNEISLYARISAIADIFDALTTRRSYKNAFPSFDALKLMKEQMREELDQELFKKFVLFMGGKK
ncbi:MAG: HD-GYP domain-containing protein, partial [Candidatus Hydrogenedentes bacterium]|nr:HD-GYP domain-containing protein [Candidatus Hydrogenedentota bacterium]